MFYIFGKLPYICNVKQKQIITETFLKETKITKYQQNNHLRVFKKEKKRNDIPAFIEGYLSELNNINHGNTNSK